VFRPTVPPPRPTELTLEF